MANASFLVGAVADRCVSVGAVDGTMDNAGAEELREGCWKIELGRSEVWEKWEEVSERSFVFVKVELIGEEESNLRGGIVGAVGLP